MVRTAASAARVLPAAARLLAVLLGVLAVGLLASPPAAAHAVLLSTEPADGAALAAAPGEALLRFNEPVGAPPQAVRVFDAAGERVDGGDAGHGPERSVLRVSLPADLPDGAYVVAWQVVSADTHPLRGSFAFTVGDATEVPAGALADAAPADGGLRGWEAAAAAVRWLTYSGTLLAVGGVVFLAAVHDRAPGERDRLVRLVAWAAVAGAAATVVGVPLQSAVVSGLGPAALVDLGLLEATVAGAYGASAAVRLVGLAVLLLAVARLWEGWAVAAGLAGGLVALGSFLLAGHTVTSEPRALVWAANLAHTSAGAVWFGGLVLLAVVLRARGRARGDAVGGARVVARFSALAVGSVLVVAAAGAALGWAEVRSLRGLTGTPYGWALLAKTAVVAAVVALGVYNNRRLVPAVRRAADGAWGRLQRTVGLEAGGIVAVLAVTAVLVSLAPARVEAGVGRPYAGYHALGPDHQVNLVVDPASPGTNEVHLYLLDDAGRLADIGEEVELRFRLPEAGIDGLTRTPYEAGPGHYLHVGPELSIPGRWEIDVRVLVDDFERLTATADVAVGDVR